MGVLGCNFAVSFGNDALRYDALRYDDKHEETITHIHNMTNYDFEIIGEIGYGLGSEEYVAWMLQGMEGREVNVRVCSLGGSAIAGLNIATRFKEHGNVTVHLMGMNASAATILAMGARKVCMDSNGGMLIHKCMLWMDQWGNMNADELRKTIDEMPLEVLERTPIPCQNEKLNLWRMKLNAPEGVRPATGYLAIPKDASAANRVKATGILSGYYNFAERCPSWLTNVVAGIRMYINRHGCEVDQPEAYYQQFFQPWPLPQKHFRDMALRGMQMFRYLKTLPEWNGRDLIAFGSSGGAMQTFWMAMAEPAISKVDATSAANADVFGFKYGRATCGLAQRDESLNYYDICNAAKRVKCPVVMNAGLGDYTCPPAGLSIVYRNLRCKKQITWSQGCTHGWWPAGMKKETWSSGAAEASRAGVAELTAGTGGTADPLAKMRSRSSSPRTSRSPCASGASAASRSGTAVPISSCIRRRLTSRPSRGPSGTASSRSTTFTARTR